MKKNVLVTLCDAHFIEQAKQLFSSAHFQGRWKGDYLLLAHEVPKKKTSWFIKRGILVEDCSPLYSSFIGKYPPTLTSKIYLFEEKMKQWKNIIYLDADIIVRGSLEELTKISGFAASGVMVFSSDIIKSDMTDKVRSLLYQFGSITKYGDQGIQNLYFYKKWQPLPLYYNTFPAYVQDKFHLPFPSIKATILHFADEGEQNKPWDTHNYFYKEWKHNLHLAHYMNVKQSPKKRSELKQHISKKLFYKLKELFFDMSSL